MNIAVGTEPGTLRISDRLDDEWNNVKTGAETLEVYVNTLKNACDDYDHSDVRKIDRESFELHDPRCTTEELAHTAFIFHE